MKPLIAGFVALAALTGCAPDTSAAYKNCYDTLSSAVLLDETLSQDQAISKLVDIAELCQSLSKADPEKFNEEWGS